MKSHRINPAGLSISEPCRRDEIHTIPFNEKGQLCLPHHYQARESALEDLGGEPCSCRIRLHQWKECMAAEGTAADLAKDRVPPEFHPYLADCAAEHERRKIADYYVETWKPGNTVYQRLSFLQKLLNQLLSTRLGLPDRQWLTLKYTSTGWFPGTLHYPYPGDNIRNIFPLGVRSDYVAQIYHPDLAILNGGLTLFIPAGRNPLVARQLVPRTHPVAGLCLERRLIERQPTCPSPEDALTGQGTCLDFGPIDPS